ncbi:class I SAM-dependent methyltransferase [Rivibacter subsaxonicus]|uniref:Methyltransferase family protein n=1 Tax=Rivibacter subsaxonicus TaxID=457575 RepID=A0A4Q7VGT2_9BURK|nr:class I SAM-dependent methyltransferase [Rivibacter subsaxonicus]RZT95224.1 methyltransferase family protein [Rivibacter subsaxonicus]
MKIDQVHTVVDGLCCMSFEQGRVISDLVLENRFRDLLELGFNHGVSSCYLAAALDEQGGGLLTTIDLEEARTRSPNIGELLGRLGLERYVKPCFEPTSYLWRLMRMLEEDPSPRFDFCYIDGAHDWFCDGFAFLLVDRLLRPGGMIVFDDLDWSYATSRTLKATERVLNMPADERELPQVRKVYELLVKTHPGYGDFAEKDGWAYARKLRGEGGAAPLRSETVYVDREVGLGAALLRMARRVAR